MLTNSEAWQALKAHADAMAGVHMRDLFNEDPQRGSRFAVEAAHWYLDYSKNNITDETLKLLVKLAEQQQVEQWRERQFSGAHINHTEDRAVLHTALRQRGGADIVLDNENITAAIQQTQRQMQRLVESLRSGEWRGYSGQPINTIVNIGIGGSDLGPAMVCEALTPYVKADLPVHFVSNIDGMHLRDVLAKCDSASTLFIVASKSFTTQETLTNAQAARQWFLQQGGPNEHLAKHFIAVTANNRLATEFGIAEDAQLQMWDWVGGRYSLWSAIGLPIACAIGMDRFTELLDGANAMDEHFCSAPLMQNMPVILALLGVWHNNFCGFESYAVVPYVQHLASLHAYLQQADMESNGKRIDRQGLPVAAQTGPVIWGGVGTNAQHAFFQLMHQGTKTIPADFILVRDGHADDKQPQKMLLANALAQMEALMRGKSADQARQELLDKGYSKQRCDELVPYMEFAGNKPSNALLTERLTPAALGALIALYEHKIAVQGFIWNINSYDQWGVEYGKQLAKQVLLALNESGQSDAAQSNTEWSSSTQQLLSRLGV